MQLTIDSDDDLQHVLQVVGAMYGVEYESVDEPGPGTPDLSLGGGGDEGVTKIRHRTRPEAQ